MTKWYCVGLSIPQAINALNGLTWAESEALIDEHRLEERTELLTRRPDAAQLSSASDASSPRS